MGGMGTRLDGIDFMPVCEGLDEMSGPAEHPLRPTLRELTLEAHSLVAEIVAGSPRLDERNVDLHLLRADLDRYSQMLHSDLDQIEQNYAGYSDEDFQALLRMLPEDMAYPELTADSMAIIEKVTRGLSGRLNAETCSRYVSEAARALYGSGALEGRSTAEMEALAAQFTELALPGNPRYEGRLSSAARLICDALRPEELRRRYHL